MTLNDPKAKAKVNARVRRSADALRTVGAATIGIVVIVAAIVGAGAGAKAKAKANAKAKDKGRIARLRHLRGSTGNAVVVAEWPTWTKIAGSRSNTGK